MHDQAKWDRRFLGLAGTVSEWSKDPSSRIGAVIVRPDLTVASLGFNGFARGLDDDPPRYLNRDFKIATVIHAETNAILSAHGPVRDCTIYVSGLPPCATCASMLIQAGIKRVVSWHKQVPLRWATNMRWAAENLLEAGVAIRTYAEDADGWWDIERPEDLWVQEPLPMLPVSVFDHAAHCAC